MKKALILYFFALCCYFPVKSFGQAKKFVKEYAYRLEDEDSRNTAKMKAQEQLRKILMSEALVYVRKSNAAAESAAADISVNLYKEAIVVNMHNKLNILEEKFDGFEYWIKGEIEVDIEEINAYAAEKSKINEGRTPSVVLSAGTGGGQGIETVRNVTNNAVNVVESADKAAKALGGLGKVGGGLGGALGAAKQVKSAVNNTLDAVESVQNIAGAVSGGTGGGQGIETVRNVTNNAVNVAESADKAAKALGGLGKVGGGLGGALGAAKQVKSAVDNTLDAVESVQNIAGTVKGVRQSAGYDVDVSITRNNGGSRFSLFSIRWEYVAMLKTNGFGGCIEFGGIDEEGFYNTVQLSAGNAYFGGEWNIGGCFNKSGVKGNYKSVLGVSLGYRQASKYVRFTENGYYDGYSEETGKNNALIGMFWKLLLGSENNFELANKFMLGTRSNPESYVGGDVSYEDGGNITYVLSIGYTLTKMKR